MTTFTEQSHLEMPPPGWLLVNGVSLATDVQQQPLCTADHRMKYIISPPGPTNPMQFTTTMNDKQYQKVENTDLPKKLFIDRQIQKAKSLTGLIKGTALSHHSAHYTDPTNNSQNDSFLINDNDSCRTQRTSETRRPRVSFSEFNKVQFFEDGNDNAQQSTHRRHNRHHSSRRSTTMGNHNHVSPPSIQHSQALYKPYRPLSRQQPIGHELNIRKQQLIASPRVPSSRAAHLPDILNQTLPTENSHNYEKYVLQREKSFFQFPEPAAEIAVNSSTEISRESTRAGGNRSTAVVPDYYDLNDSSVTNTLLNSSSITSSFANRYRPALRTISLRQQFTTPIKTKSISFSNNNQQIPTNTRRSASLKHAVMRNQSVNNDHDDISNHHVLSTLENRPMTGINYSSKHLKRNYIIHFNQKNPFNGNTTIDSSETNRYLTRSNIRESSPERFQNVLKIVRPPYITTLNNSHPDSTLQQATTNHLNGNRSSRTTSGHEYHHTSNTISV